jgi:hypothetical protein
MGQMSDMHHKDIQRRLMLWDRRDRVPLCKNHPDKLVKPSAWINRGIALHMVLQQPIGPAAGTGKISDSAAGKEQRRWQMRSWRLARQIAENKF